MKTLHIAEGLDLPLSSVSRTFGLLAVRGAGKSNAAAVMAEEMFAAGLPFVVIDPVGSWYGLRSSGDGSGPGLPIPIFGGKHGDVPLDRSNGVILADLVVSKRLTCVLDLSTFESEGARKQFLLDFARQLYLKNEDPLHLFLEEADDYIPQRPQRDEAQLLRAWENIVRRGRSRGLGMTMITQRSAAINKMVLTQVETLIALRTTSPQDIAVIREWVKYHQTGDDVLSSLASLPDGVAWIWSPQFLQVMKKVQIRRRRTFDSGATPKNFTGSNVKHAATLADINLADIQKQMASTIEKIKADDPRELRKQIATLTAELKKANTFQSQSAPVPPKIVEVSILTDEDRALLTSYGSMNYEVGKATERLRLHSIKIQESIDRVLAKSKGAQHSLTKPPTAHTVKHLGPFVQKARSPISTNSEVMGNERKILTVLAQYPDGKDKVALAHLSGYTVNGHFNNLLGSLRSKGFAQPGNPVRITDEGRNALGAFDPLPTGEELRQYWMNKVPPVEAKILGPLLEAYPKGLLKEDLAQAAGYTINGHFNNLLGHLRTMGIVQRGNPVIASPTLFE